MLDAAIAMELSITPTDILEARIYELSSEPDFAQHPDFIPAMSALAKESPIRAARLRDWLEIPSGEPQ